MSGRYDRRSSMGNSQADDPPNSRLFVVSGKNLTEDDFHNAFSRFGTIEELWIVKDKQTKENKGVTYIKFAKTSEAAAALEEMNGRCIQNCPRPLKVMIAASRDKGCPKDQINEEERSQRLFVVVPKTMSDQELKDYFRQFGDVEYANIIIDKSTRESKGVAYVKYYKFSHAAKAYEECDRKYRAVFAEPRKPNAKQEDRSFSFDQSPVGRSSYMPPPPRETNDSDGYTVLSVITHPSVTEDQLWRLFDILPGMDFCQLQVDNRNGHGMATVVYTDHRWAARAKEKLHGFEYPPGHRLIVKPDYDHRNSGDKNLPEKRKADLLTLAETIAQASSLIQAAGFSPDLIRSGIFGKDDTQCSVKLPDSAPLADIDDPVEARCFIVCTPSPLSPPVLKDVFCRFGSLIDVYMLANRNCGYAKYASRMAAETAIKTLHGAEVNGIRLKVVEADELPASRKRAKTDDY